MFFRVVVSVQKKTLLLLAEFSLRKNDCRKLWKKKTYFAVNIISANLYSLQEGGNKECMYDSKRCLISIQSETSYSTK